MKLLLIYPPFCSPASPPYSLTNIAAFLKANSSHDIRALDLNILWHNFYFKEYGDYYRNLNPGYNFEEYDKKTKSFRDISEKTYTESNNLVVKGQKPLLFKEILKAIKDENPDMIAFSLVFSSQCHYTYSLVEQLEKEFPGKIIVGGPAVNEKLKQMAVFLKNELELLEAVENKKIVHDTLNFNITLDFSIFPLKEYFTPQPVIPIRTCSSCYYRKCTFCTHHQHSAYFEFPLENIKNSVKEIKNIFITDDMIHNKRLLALADILKGKTWMCQLKPKDMDYSLLKKLSDSGMKYVLWGVESGSDRILRLMRKETNKEEIAQVLRDSKKAGITNIVFIMFAFPTETKEEFLETIEFLKENRDNIDLISTSVFGLHRGSYIYEHPEEFGITKVIEQKRTILEPKISYELSHGMTQEEASRLRKRHKKTLESINKFPSTMNFFREHMFLKKP